MRKINFLIGTGVLLLGMLIGMTAFAVMANPTLQPAALLNRLQGEPAATVVKAGTSDALSESLSTDGTLHAAGFANSAGVDTGADTGALTGDGTGPDTAPDPGALPAEGTESGLAANQTQPPAVAAQLAEQIIADYKQDLGIFFDAWRAEDMTQFRTQLATAYVGELFEKHARRAEPYLVQGIGLEVSAINFDNVTVESATDTTATVRADYRYTAQDYSLALGEAVGYPHEHSVHVRANLIKLNGHWLVTGETILQ